MSFHLVLGPLLHWHIVNRCWHSPVVLQQEILGHSVLLARNLSIVDLLTLVTEPFFDSRHPGKTLLIAAAGEHWDRPLSGITLVMFRAGAPRYESCGTS